VGTSRRVRYSALVVSLELLFCGPSDAWADPPAAAEAEASASHSTSDTPKTLPEGSVFSSLTQSFNENPDLQVVRGHFDLGSPPNVRRYYCLINTKTGNRGRNGVLGEPVPHADGTTGIKNIAVSLYSCADAQQEGMLVTAGFVWSGRDNGPNTPALRARTSAEPPPPPPGSSADKNDVAAATMTADASGWATRAATWEKEFNADNLKGVVALYAADGCRMPPNAETAQGSEAILASLQSAKDHGIAKVRIAVTSTETSGNLADATGTFEVSGADGKQLDHGKWMGVSKKTNGKWKTQCDIWNSDMPMPGNKAK
jgi:ketosteroid isomerase-like protein